MKHKSRVLVRHKARRISCEINRHQKFVLFNSGHLKDLRRLSDVAATKPLRRSLDCQQFRSEDSCADLQISGVQITHSDRQMLFMFTPKTAGSFLSPSLPSGQIRCLSSHKPVANRPVMLTSEEYSRVRLPKTSKKTEG